MCFSAMQRVMVTASGCALADMMCVHAELHAEAAESGGLCDEHACVDTGHSAACHGAVLVS